MDGPREQLEAERDRLLRHLAGLTGDFNDVVEAARDANGDDEHDPEGATIAYERAQVSALVRPPARASGAPRPLPSSPELVRAG